MLSNERIEELASKKGVNRIAVLNFLGTVGANKYIEYAYMNLNMDSRLYKWHQSTIDAITEGIEEYFSK